MNHVVPMMDEKNHLCARRDHTRAPHDCRIDDLEPRATGGELGLGVRRKISHRQSATYSCAGAWNMVWIAWDMKSSFLFNAALSVNRAVQEHLHGLNFYAKISYIMGRETYTSIRCIVHPPCSVWPAFNISVGMDMWALAGLQMRDDETAGDAPSSTSTSNTTRAWVFPSSSLSNTSTS